MNNIKEEKIFIKIKIIIILIISGLCINIASFFYNDSKFPQNAEMIVVGKIVSLKENTEYYNKYILKIIHNINNEKIKNCKIIVYIDKNYEFIPGDIIKVEGEFNKPDGKRNYGGFNYKKYLKQDKIFGIIQASNAKKIGEKRNALSIIQLIRLNISKKIDKLYEKEYAGFLNGLLIGKTDEILEEIQTNFKNSNISHVLAISGMHVSYVIIGVKLILEKILKNKRIQNYLLILFLYVFCIITGLSESCIRACIMTSMIFIASNLHRKNNFYISFVLSFIIIILINPYNIFNIGMWLSYTGTLGIVLFYKILSDLIKYKINKKTDSKINNKLINMIIDNFCVTVSAQILIFPIIVYVFNSISLTFFISNIFISFVIGPILIGGYLSVFVSYIFLPLSRIIVIIEKYLIYIILLISKICAKLPFSNIYVKTPNFLFVMSYYFFIILSIYYVKRRKFYILKLLISYNYFIKEIVNVKNKIITYKKKIIKYKKKIIKIIYVVIICIVIFKLYKIYFPELKIYFVDVGQGDCSFIQTPNGKNLIVDAGEGNTDKYDYGKNVVLPYLLDRGVCRIDYLIISHADSDHIGGLFAILENIKVDKILIGIQAQNSEQFNDLVKIANKKNIPIIILKGGDKIKIEKNIYLEILWPIKEKLIKENILNNNSLVFKLVFDENSILFTGDIEKIAERQIVEKYKKELQCNILKVAHHGSKTSSNQEFIKYSNPQIALIGVGKNNKFGHPNLEVIDCFEKNNTQIYRTDLQGEICIKISKYKKIKINCENN